jgi:hypothetical protein
MSKPKFVVAAVLDVFTKIKHIQYLANQKYDAVINTLPHYTMFERPPTHPYYELLTLAEDLRDNFEALVAAMCEVEIEAATLRLHLDLRAADLLVNKDGQTDDNLNYLRASPVIEVEPDHAAVVSDIIKSIYSKLNSINNLSDKKTITAALAKDGITARTLNGHLETPFVSIKRDVSACNTAFLKLLKLMIDLPLGKKSVRQFLTARVATAQLSGKQHDGIEHRIANL